MLRKVVYLYEYMDGWVRFNETLCVVGILLQSNNEKHLIH